MCLFSTAAGWSDLRIAHPPVLPPGNPVVVQLFPPVDMIRMVEAVTAPVVAVLPAAVTQSPTARSEAVAVRLSV
jgi:hypothetical protein